MPNGDPEPEPERSDSKGSKNKRREPEWEDDERDRRQRTSAGSKRDAKSLVQVPAIGLMVTGGLGLIGLVVVLAIVLPGWGGGGLNKLAMAIVLLSIAWPFALAYAGWELLNLGSRQYIGYGIVLALLPCNPAVPLGWVFGLWAMKLLKDRRIRRYLQD